MVYLQGLKGEDASMKLAETSGTSGDGAGVLGELFTGIVETG
jgi:hypothetical protein